jgi:hypothetical protein
VADVSNFYLHFKFILFKFAAYLICGMIEVSNILKINIIHNKSQI